MIQGYGRNRNYTILRDAILGIEIITINACTTTRKETQTTVPEEHPVNTEKSTILTDAEMSNTHQQDQTTSPQTVIQPQQDYTQRIQNIEQQITEIRQNNNATLEEITRQKETINNMNTKVTTLDGQVTQMTETVNTLTKKYESKIDYTPIGSELRQYTPEIRTEIKEPQYTKTQTYNILLLEGALGILMVGFGILLIRGMYRNKKRSNETVPPTTPQIPREEQDDGKPGLRYTPLGIQPPITDGFLTTDSGLETRDMGRDELVPGDGLRTLDLRLDQPDDNTNIPITPIVPTTETQTPSIQPIEESQKPEERSMVDLWFEPPKKEEKGPSTSEQLMKEILKQK